MGWICLWKIEYKARGSYYVFVYFYEASEIKKFLDMLIIKY
jgi:hypothetical protein